MLAPMDMGVVIQEILKDLRNDDDTGKMLGSSISCSRDEQFQQNEENVSIAEKNNCTGDKPNKHGVAGGRENRVCSFKVTALMHFI